MHDEIGPEPPIELTLTDVLDLHSFPPSEVAGWEWRVMGVALENNWRRVRIIHGKGKGVQRQTVRKILERDPRVASFGDASGEAGGWGATLVVLHGPSS